MCLRHCRPRSSPGIGATVREPLERTVGQSDSSKLSIRSRRSRESKARVRERPGRSGHLGEHRACTWSTDIGNQSDHLRRRIVGGVRLADQVERPLPCLHESHAGQHPLLLIVAGHRVEQRHAGSRRTECAPRKAGANQVGGSTDVHGLSLRATASPTDRVGPNTLVRGSTCDRTNRDALPRC